MNQGAKIIVHRDGEAHYLRLAERQGAKLVMLTRPLAIALADLAALETAEKHIVYLEDELVVRVDGHRAVAVLDGAIRWGPRRALTDALVRIAH